LQSHTLSKCNDIVLGNTSRHQKLENKVDLPFFARDRDVHKKINEGIIEIYEVYNRYKKDIRKLITNES